MPKPVRRASPVSGSMRILLPLMSLMNETALMQMCHGVGHGNSKSQERSDRQARADHLVERPGRRGLEHQHRLPAFTHQLQRTECPRVIEVILQTILMRQTADRAGCGVFGAGLRHQEFATAAVIHVAPRSCGRGARRRPRESKPHYIALLTDSCALDEFAHATNAVAVKTNYGFVRGDLARPPYSFSGSNSRSGVSRSPSVKSSMRVRPRTAPDSAEDRTPDRPPSGSAAQPPPSAFFACDLRSACVKMVPAATTCATDASADLRGRISSGSKEPVSRRIRLVFQSTVGQITDHQAERYLSIVSRKPARHRALQEEIRIATEIVGRRE